jgi:hypothetical protein
MEDLDRGEATEHTLDTGLGVSEERTLSEDQRKTLSARMLVDAQFRRDLLRDPGAAAARLGITLSEWERNEILKFAKQIREFGKKADGILSQPKVRAGGIIPQFILD